MKKDYSIKGRKLFLDVYRLGRKYQGQGVRVYIMKINPARLPEIFLTNRNHKIKIGIAINRRYGSAVMRNRAKRIIRSVCDEMIDEMKDGYLIIFRPDERFRDMSYSGIAYEIKNMLLKAGVIG